MGFFDNIDNMKQEYDRKQFEKLKLKAKESEAEKERITEEIKLRKQIQETQELKHKLKEQKFQEKIDKLNNSYKVFD